MTEKSARLAPKEQANLSFGCKEKSEGVMGKAMGSSLGLKARGGKRKDQISFTVFNSILEYFS